MNPLLAQRNGKAVSDLFQPIARDLDKMETVLRGAIQNDAPGVGKLLDHLAHYRGKRLRPALLLLTARACGKVAPSHHVLAAVVEMIHTATLVHDDVLDGASIRRHGSTMNAAWGNQASILLGDYLFTHAFHLTSTLGDADACRIIGESTNRLCAGELHQICQSGNLDLSEDAYCDIIDGKTAELTSCCCRLGALYAGMDEEIVQSLAAYGRALGMAFQIADDLLDLVGEERSVGKSLGTDLEQQKLTLPVIYYLQQGSAKSTKLRPLLENPSRQTRLTLAQELAASGALDYARKRAEAYAIQAAEQLDALPPTECRSVLLHLTEKVVNRDH